MMKRHFFLLAVLFCGMTSIAQVKIAVLGSSTAFGAGSTSGNTSWAGRLQAYYQKNTSDGADTTLYIKGGYGYTTYRVLPTGYVTPVDRGTAQAIDVAQNINAALADNPQILIINLPSNDVGFAYSTNPPYTVKESMDNFRVLYNYATSRGVKTYVTSSQPRNDYPDNMRQLLRDLKDSITAYFGANAIDYFDDLATTDGTNRLRDDVRHIGYADADYHLNDNGHNLIYQKVVAKNIFGGTVTPPPPPPTTTTGRIEAEAYTAMFGIQKEATSDVGGGENVAWQDTGDWMDYSVNVSTAGTYTVNFRVATMFTGPQFQVRSSSGTVLATVTVPNTGSFQTWTTVSAQVSLAAGTQTIRVYTSNAAGGWNFNWLEVGSLTTTPPPPPPPPTTSATKYEAENYTAMFGIQKENTSDVGGGQNVAWQDTNDWMDYSVSTSAAGTYTLNFRVATMFNGPQFQVRNSAGAVLATVSVPNTGSFQAWQTISAQVSLAAGTQTIRIYTTNAAGGWNINWFEIVGGTSTPPPTTASQKIEAEAYTAMFGIQKETTSDVGGGENVAWQDTGDWMDYSVNVSTAGTYTMNFRVATMFNGPQFQVRSSSGTVLATLFVPNTGGFQAWQTISAQVSLAAGQQTIRIYTTNAAGGWNINWFEIASTTSATAAQVSSASSATISEISAQGNGLEVFPNPVQDRFTLSVDNAFTGSLKAEVVSVNGSVAKAFQLQKTTEGKVQFYLSIGDIPSGAYVVKATMQSWTSSTQIIKE